MLVTTKRGDGPRLPNFTGKKNKPGGRKRKRRRGRRGKRRGGRARPKADEKEEAPGKKERRTSLGVLRRPPQFADPVRKEQKSSTVREGRVYRRDSAIRPKSKDRSTERPRRTLLDGKGASNERPRARIAAIAATERVSINVPANRWPLSMNHKLSEERRCVESNENQIKSRESRACACVPRISRASGRCETWATRRDASVLPKGRCLRSRFRACAINIVR